MKYEPIGKGLSRVGVPKRLWDASLADYPKKNASGLRIPKNNDGYYITGPTGTGKSHLAVAILVEWIRLGKAKLANTIVGACPEYEIKGAAFITVMEYLGRIKASFGDKSEYPSEEWIIRSYQNAKCLILDDFGSENPTEWSFSALYRLVDYRTSQLLPLIVTSNHSLDEVDAIDPRIASRLSGLQVINLGGSDRRSANK